MVRIGPGTSFRSDTPLFPEIVTGRTPLHIYVAAHRVDFRVRHFGGVFVFHENSGLDMGLVKNEARLLAGRDF